MPVGDERGRLVPSAPACWATFHAAGVLAWPTCTRPGRSAGSRRGGRRTGAAGRWRSPSGRCATARCASTCRRSTTPSSTRREESVDVGGCPGRSPPPGWPPAGESAGHRRRRPVRRGRPLRLVGGLLYLERYWQQEEQVRLARCSDRAGPDRRRSTPPGCAAATGPAVPPARRPGTRPAAAGGGGQRAALGDGVGRRSGHREDDDRGPAAGAAAATSPAARCGSPWPPRPGKAAARMDEAMRQAAAELPGGRPERLGDLRASTLHRLLGWLPAPGAGSGTTPTTRCRTTWWSWTRCRWCR